MRRNNTCDSCIKKKRKCDRNRPRCGNCVASGLDCHYSETRSTKSIEGNQMHLEERLQKLEAMLSAVGGMDSVSERNIFLPIQPPDYSKQPPKMFHQIPFEIKQQILDDYREDLVTLSFKIINCKDSARNSQMLLQSLHSLGSLICPPSSLPMGMTSRSDMGSIYYDKALSFFSLVISTPNEHGILCIFILAFAAFKLDRIQEGLAFFSLSINMAREVGINKEITLNSLTSFEYERENLRGLWWCLFTVDRFLFEKNCNQIVDTDNQLYLPMFEKAPNYHSQDKLAVFGLQIMSSSDWFTPGLPNQSLEAYRILLIRIFGLALKFNYMTKYMSPTDTSHSPLCIMATMEGSLREWRFNLPKYITTCLELAQSDKPILDPDYTWKVVYTFVQYHHIRSLVFHPCLLKNVLESVSEAKTSRAFLESVKIGHENAEVLTCYLRRNNRFEYCTSTIGNYIFQSLFPLILASRMGLAPEEKAKVAESLEIHLRALRENCLAHEVIPILPESAEYLLSLHDPVDIIAQFSRFQAMADKENPPVNLINGNATTWSATEATVSMNHMQINQEMKAWDSNNVGIPLNPTLSTSYVDMLLSSDPFYN